MNLFVKGYTIFITGAVLVSMLSVILSAESHIRTYTYNVCIIHSIMKQSMQKQDVIIDSPIIVADDYAMHTYDFRDNTLQSEVENRKLYLFGDYIQKPIKSIPIAVTSNDYSSFSLMDSGKGFSLAFFRNVCYDSESSRVVLFGNSLDRSLLSTIMNVLPRNDLFAILDGTYPSVAENKEISSYGSYLFLTDDITDFVSQFSSLHFMLHFAHHTSRYPALLHAILPFFQESVLSDTYEYISIIQSFYSPLRSFDVYYKSDLPSGLLCFRELTIPTPIQYANEGSIHLDFYEADTVRIAAYSYYRIFTRFSVPSTCIVLHITYKSDKEKQIGTISNMDELDAFFHKKIAIWSYRTIEIDSVTKATKLRALYETDILMGVSNDLLVNMIYLAPGSCVLAINHNLLTSSHFNSIAEHSQLFYLEISNFSVPIPHACSDKESNVEFHMYSERCKQELLKSDIYVQPGMLMSYLRVEKTYTMIHKYYDESEGEYV